MSTNGSESQNIMSSRSTASDTGDGIFCVPASPLWKFIKKVLNIVCPPKSLFNGGVINSDVEHTSLDRASNSTLAVCDNCSLPIGAPLSPPTPEPFTDHSSPPQEGGSFEDVENGTLDWVSDSTMYVHDDCPLPIDVAPTSPSPTPSAEQQAPRQLGNIHRLEVSAVDDPYIHYLQTFDRFCQGMIESWQDAGLGHDARHLIWHCHHPLPPPSLVSYETEPVVEGLDMSMKVIIKTQVSVKF
ncbi:hypothetical protein NP233_g6022 [Leucocoprinus birnbaumii]|uniref:Uncharacterized protein n=1 Tax=Leucocoprinus birnbaumii TaxID=56174 RepID=A0AAD5YVX5_9AGAR|nr:hypothetical protein NP233_g6022 [Leucocoprinus birnbaumii]